MTTWLVMGRGGRHAPSGALAHIVFDLGEFTAPDDVGQPIGTDGRIPPRAAGQITANPLSRQPASVRRPSLMVNAIGACPGKGVQAALIIGQ
jgi:hypothetical protein